MCEYCGAPDRGCLIAEDWLLEIHGEGKKELIEKLRDHFKGICWHWNVEEDFKGYESKEYNDFIDELVDVVLHREEIEVELPFRRLRNLVN